MRLTFMNGNVPFSHLDIHFARFLKKLAGDGGVELFLASALLSRSVADGHVCLDLKDFEGGGSLFCGADIGFLSTPSPEIWLKKLEESPVVGRPGDERPLILDDHSRLYLYRYWEYEKILADRILDLAHVRMEKSHSHRLREMLARLFPAAPAGKTQWQRIAAWVSFFKRFAVISGSPGTGKTSTIAGILALLIEMDETDRIRIALATPTGKAAARLEESIGRMKPTLACSDPVRSRLPEKATTLHRLLGSPTISPSSHHHAGNPLPYDLVVVDEASMADLPLMSRLVQAMTPASRLILLGDKNQLASVEAGAVLGDICGPSDTRQFSRPLVDPCGEFGNGDVWDPFSGGESTGLQDCIVELRENYRFAESGDIDRFGKAVISGDGPGVVEGLKSGHYRDVQWSKLPEARNLPLHLKPLIRDGFRDYWDLIDAAGPLENLFDAFDRFRVLCALRHGPYGSLVLNEAIEHILREEGRIGRRETLYPGRPVMILRNDTGLSLFNGDVGLILQPGGGESTAVFREGPGRFRHFSPRRLPEHETVYAMTVHKSQGSEFDDILLLLSDRDVPLLTRELIYTGVTRARNRVLLWCDETVLERSISRRIERSSGLQDRLWRRHRP